MATADWAGRLGVLAATLAAGSILGLGTAAAACAAPADTTSGPAAEAYGGWTVFKPYPQDLKPNFWTSANVSGWFGGNETAPRTLSYYLRAR